MLHKTLFITVQQPLWTQALSGMHSIMSSVALSGLMARRMQMPFLVFAGISLYCGGMTLGAN